MCGPVGKFTVALAPVQFWKWCHSLAGISLQKICCVTHFHNNACSILPVGQRGQSLRGGASPAPVVAENFLYAGAQNPSASPVKEVAPPVRGGEFTVLFLSKFFIKLIFPLPIKIMIYSAVFFDPWCH